MSDISTNKNQVKYHSHVTVGSIFQGLGDGSCHRHPEFVTKITSLLVIIREKIKSWNNEWIHCDVYNEKSKYKN